MTLPEYVETTPEHKPEHVRTNIEDIPEFENYR